MPANNQRHHFLKIREVYNSRILQMPSSSRARWFACVVLLLSQLALATDWHQPVAQIATKISSATGPGVVALEITNRSSISAADAGRSVEMLAIVGSPVPC